jgi:hypothetical protein
MTSNSEVIDMIIRRLGNRRSSPQLRQVIAAELRTFISMKEKDMKEPPFFLETVWETTVTGLSVDLPANFLRELEEHVMSCTSDGCIFEVTKRIPDFVRSMAISELAQRPHYYSILGDKLYFGPGLDKPYLITLPYARKSEVFVDNGLATTDWVLHAENAVMLSVQHTLALDILQDQEMAERVEQRLGEAWQMFNDYCNARKYANLTIASGDD